MSQVPGCRSIVSSVSRAGSIDDAGYPDREPWNGRTDSWSGARSASMRSSARSPSFTASADAWCGAAASTHRVEFPLDQQYELTAPDWVPDAAPIVAPRGGASGTGVGPAVGAGVGTGVGVGVGPGSSVRIETRCGSTDGTPTSTVGVPRGGPPHAAERRPATRSTAPAGRPDKAATRIRG